MSAQPNLPLPVPAAVAALQEVYGLPSQAGFGSAVFYEQVDRGEDLEQIALKYYRYFVGDLWDRWGKTAWMTPWKLVYQRELGDAHQIIAEMRSIADSNTALLVPLLLDEIEDADAAQTALSDLYNDASMVDLVLYALGDGAAISGLLVAGRRTIGDATFLVFLLD